MGRKPLDGTPEAQGLAIRPGLIIPQAELEVRRTRSGGPGGQNVNKVNTRIELLFDVRHSAVLSQAQKERILARLATRISKAGILRVTSQVERTQARNEARARRRLAQLVDEALQQRRARRPTRPTRSAAQRRVETKKQRSRIKEKRRKPGFDDA